MHDYKDVYAKAGLIVRHFQGKLSPEEEKALKSWLQEDERNQAFMESLRNSDELQKELAFFSSIDEDQAWANLSEKMNRPGRNFFLKKILNWKYAAIFIAVLTTGLLFYRYSNKKNEPAIAQRSQRFKNDVLPGGNKARLTLADGSVVILEDAANGTLSRQSGVKISKRNGQLVYEITSSAKAGQSSAFNTITTPVGGQYQVILPDGTQVWLNASSALSYPVAFTGNERVVRLSGEAYFEVAKNKKMPFKVRVADWQNPSPDNDMTVKVLGTHFNVMAYNDEKQVNTTLLEGAVTVSKGNHTERIVPGQVASLDRQQATFRVTNADVEKAIAWKNGLFLFNREDAQTIMRQLARWYNVEIKYSGEQPKGHFTGVIARNKNISKVLTMLELTGGVHFIIEGKKITVFK